MIPPFDNNPKGYGPAIITILHYFCYPLFPTIVTVLPKTYPLLTTFGCCCR